MTKDALAQQLTKSVTPGEEGEFDWREAEQLGVFVELAVTEQEARESWEGVDAEGVA